MTYLHPVLKQPISGPAPEGIEIAYFGMGCYWGAERMFYQTDGVWSTSVGFMGGTGDNPSYEDVCSGKTGHAEIVKVYFDPKVISYEGLLKKFWENHDPTQGMRQGNDIGAQYRSVIFTTDAAQQKTAEASKEAFAPVVTQAGLGSITTHIAPAMDYFEAHEAHQQYLHKNPAGYCNLGPNGMSCPVGVI